MRFFEIIQLGSQIMVPADGSEFLKSLVCFRKAELSRNSIGIQSNLPTSKKVIFFDVFG